MKRLILLIYKRGKWEVTGDLPDGVKKCIIIAAPHTSWMDFIYGRAVCYIKDINPKVFIKKEAFFWPFKKALKNLGGIPVNRQKTGSIVSHTVDIINKSENFVLAITPEGTRERRKNWKKGYYYIAQSANIPIVLGSIDYKTRMIHIGPAINPSGDYHKDYQIIKEFYTGITAKFPEKFAM